MATAVDMVVTGMDTDTDMAMVMAVDMVDTAVDVMVTMVDTMGVAVVAVTVDVADVEEVALFELQSRRRTSV